MTSSSNGRPPAGAPSTGGGWRLEHSYASLPDALHEAREPVPVAEPGLYLLNHSLAENLGLDPEALARPELAGLFTGNLLPEGARPLAQAYSGHQFGSFVRLGDGRAILLGEQITPDRRRLDVQLKGSGRTSFSRGGDGRAALGPMLREYVISEAMHGLGIPTTRSLAVATTGEPVFRETALPGAILTRVAASHLRVGTFQHAAALDYASAGRGEAPEGEAPLLTALVDYALERHHADLLRADNRALALLEAVVESQAALIARWMAVGFVHGVMNTDNAAISGETIDYGPCAFLDVYDPATVFSSIDHAGRYAYGNQPRIGGWNVARFAEALLPVLAAEEAAALELAQEAVSRFSERFETAWLGRMRGKLGLMTEEAGDAELVEELLSRMAETGSDFTNSFLALEEGRAPDSAPNSAPNSAPGAAADGDAAFDSWLAAWRKRVEREPEGLDGALEVMRRSNPVVIARNHRVEEALQAAWRDGDKGPLLRLLEQLEDPFDREKDREGYQDPAPQGSLPYRTFCGT